MFSSRAVFQRSRFPAAALAVVALMSGATAAASAEPAGSIRHAGGPDAIAGSYIVVLKGASQDAATTAGALAQRYSASVKDVYGSALRGFSAEMDEEQARKMAADPAVAYVEQDQVVRPDTVQVGPTWGLDRIDQRDRPLNAQYAYDATGAGVTAYVLDSGIRITHQDFGGRARYGRDTVDEDDIASDCTGHGTHVAGTIGGSHHGVAKAVKLVAVRVLGCASGRTSDVVQGVDWVTANHIKPAVANMSLGGPASTALDDAVRASIAAGVSYVVAAGNSGTTSCDRSPAGVAAALTVGATTPRDRRANFSNLGSCVDLFAPGEQVVSTWHISDDATMSLDGTSMSAPHAAGAAALYLSKNPGAAPDRVNLALKDDATRGRIIDLDAASPNLLLHRPLGPVVTHLVCDQGEAHYICDAGATSGIAPLALTWKRDGHRVPEWDGRGSVTSACAPGEDVDIEVTITDANGLTDREALAFPCTDEPI